MVQPTTVPTQIVAQTNKQVIYNHEGQIDPNYKGEQKIYVKISHYEPWKGGVNCGSFVNGECVSHMASGKHWQDYVEKAIACPKEVPFNTRIIVDGREWTCLDRGGAIIKLFDEKLQAHVFWIDELTKKASHPFGTVHEAILILP